MSEVALNNHKAGSKNIPREILFAASLLVGFALIASGTAHLSDVGTLHMPQRHPVVALSLFFEDQANGAVAVRDAADRQIIFMVQPGTNGFIRATMRGLAQERLRDGIGSETAFKLTHWDDGTMSLADPATGREISLDAFGPSNSGAFAQIFSARNQERSQIQ